MTWQLLPRYSGQSIDSKGNPMAIHEVRWEGSRWQTSRVVSAPQLKCLARKQSQSTHWSSCAAHWLPPSSSRRSNFLGLQEHWRYLSQLQPAAKSKSALSVADIYERSSKSEYVASYESSSIWLPSRMCTKELKLASNIPPKALLFWRHN